MFGVPEHCALGWGWKFAQGWQHRTPDLGLPTTFVSGIQPDTSDT